MRSNVRAIEESIEAFNEGDWDRFFSSFAEDVVRHAPDLPEPLRGRAAFRKHIETYLDAFSDLGYREVRLFGEGEFVCMEAVLQVTHSRPLQVPGGRLLAPTNRKLESRDCVIFRLEGGQVKEFNAYWDQLAFLKKLGLAP